MSCTPESIYPPDSTYLDIAKRDPRTRSELSRLKRKAKKDAKRAYREIIKDLRDAAAALRQFKGLRAFLPEGGK